MDGRQADAEKEGLVKSLKAIGRSEGEIRATLAARPAPEADGGEALWAAHAPAFEAFLVAARQWRVAVGLGAIFYLGLDYGACDVAWRRAGVSLDARAFDDFQVIEGEAARLLNMAGEKA